MRNPRLTATQALCLKGTQKIEGIPSGFDAARAVFLSTRYGTVVVEPNSKPHIIRDGVARELEV